MDFVLCAYATCNICIVKCGGLPITGPAKTRLAMHGSCVKPRWRRPAWLPHPPAVGKYAPSGPSFGPPFWGLDYLEPKPDASFLRHAPPPGGRSS